MGPLHTHHRRKYRSAWASFQPRQNLPRLKPGTLYYPDEASHVFQDFWNHLGNLPAAPGFNQCSPVCQECMAQFSQVLSQKYNCRDWETLPVADAPEKLARIAKDAAISRVRPIMDGPNQWEMHRSSAVTVGPASSPQGGSIVGTESHPTTGSTGTCVAGCNPLNAGGALFPDG
jgi:hypothetical protein